MFRYFRLPHLSNNEMMSSTFDKTTYMRNCFLRTHVYTVCFMSICDILESQVKPGPESTFPDRTEELRQFF